MFFGWLVAREMTKVTPLIWKIKDTAGNIGVYLIILALIGAILGKGKSRAPTAACAVLGLLLWVPVGVL